jgi:enterochelin esterase family protein
MGTSSGVADGTGVTFTLADRPRRLAAVRLVEHIGVPGPLPFDRVAGGWQLRLDRPAVDRMEYLLEITDHNGRTATIPDPANPRRTANPFGEKSVVEFDDYRAPGWLDSARCASHANPGRIGEIDLVVWAPEQLAADEPAPLLVVHDGPEYARLGGLTLYLAAQIAAGVVPPMRAVLLDPDDRNDDYAANADYACRMCASVLPNVAPSTVRIGVGASLGALSMLHAHHTHPGTFDALFLQSGSFFTPHLDPQESGFDRFGAVTDFVAAMHSSKPSPGHPAAVPAVITCGTVEENLANNELMAQTLSRLGYPVTFERVRDAHNYVAWRDAFDPLLANLIVQAIDGGAR